MKQFYFIALIITGALFTECANNKNDKNSNLLVNHIGYDIKGVKKVILQTTSDNIPETFNIIDSQNKVVFTGTFQKGGKIDSWHTGNAFEGDFSSFCDSGIYQVTVIPGKQTFTSEEFLIKKNILTEKCLPLLIDGFVNVRCVGEYDETDKEMSFFGDRKDIVNVHGGWYDATGEKGKYLSHLCFTNFMLPQQTPMFVWNMLESTELLINNGTCSKYTIDKLMQETTFGADFLVRMMDPEGYFYTTIFANWSCDPEKREICAYEGQHGNKTTDYQAGFREGAGITIAALARASKDLKAGEYSSETYLKTAIKGFEHLIKHNSEYIDDGKENILDDYCALMAATELYDATNDLKYRDYARLRANQLIARLSTNKDFENWWRADENGDRPYFHGAEAGLPIIALCRYLDVENKEKYRSIAINAIQKSVDFELTITNEVNNPFGYARQYIKATNELTKRSSFFIPHNNESGYWWQGENARIASLASALNMALPYLNESQKKYAKEYAADQINWILGLNPYNVCMLDGIGKYNPKYIESIENLNVRGGVCNGISAGFTDETDIAFRPLPYDESTDHRWRWSEQWTLHGSWLMLATVGKSSN